MSVDHAANYSYRFPSNVDIFNKWIRAIRRADWSPSPYSKVCSAHFTPDCFRTINDRKYLKESAVPTIFDYPAYLLPKPSGQRKSRKRELSPQPDCQAACTPEKKEIPNNLLSMSPKIMITAYQAPGK